ncbi:unnamed protein product [Arabidopsis thaliana]|jgi:hypothetical protein|uniref:Transmembrane protein n=3 Tax=Arabidopsis thaliana TaxID=3702 RepID=Q9FM73_ARATH|nr:uncharacterized protein AT5G55650 [Arabidopsis thaliana]ABE65583.1 hypothetical protein At5g55650 [Arabidopsis thaliana]AED96663.1 transmembrane protein [Arabidopsis thaliana]BAB09232.1 unnamed protein product [Arabidopsis thaliana]|eukprot:NP_200376.1 transmembrane protein [Arabidopsis thaliana]
MVEKSDDEKHFTRCCFLSQLSLLFFLVTLISSVAFLCFLNSQGVSSLTITMAILFVSSSVFLLRIFKEKTRLCLAEGSQGEGYDYEDDDDDDGLIEIDLVSEEAETIEAMRNINQSRLRIRIEEEQEEDIDDVNMEEDNLIEIDISIGSIKRRM